jgi:hypothetical protein
MIMSVQLCEPIATPPQRTLLCCSSLMPASSRQASRASNSRGVYAIDVTDTTAARYTSSALGRPAVATHRRCCARSAAATQTSCAVHALLERRKLSLDSRQLRAVVLVNAPSLAGRRRLCRCRVLSLGERASLAGDDRRRTLGGTGRGSAGAAAAAAPAAPAGGSPAIALCVRGEGWGRGEHEPLHAGATHVQRGDNRRELLLQGPLERVLALRSSVGGTHSAAGRALNSAVGSAFIASSCWTAATFASPAEKKEAMIGDMPLCAPRTPPSLGDTRGCAPAPRTHLRG